MRWALITRGTDRIGRAVAGHPAAAGNGVVIVGANNTKGIRAEREIRRDRGNSQVYFLVRSQGIDDSTRFSMYAVAAR